MSSGRNDKIGKHKNCLYWGFYVIDSNSFQICLYLLQYILLLYLFSLLPFALIHTPPLSAYYSWLQLPIPRSSRPHTGTLPSHVFPFPFLIFLDSSISLFPSHLVLRSPLSPLSYAISFHTLLYPLSSSVPSYFIFYPWFSLFFVFFVKFHLPSMEI